MPSIGEMLAWLCLLLLSEKLLLASAAPFSVSMAEQQQTANRQRAQELGLIPPTGAASSTAAPSSSATPTITVKPASTTTPAVQTTSPAKVPAQRMSESSAVQRLHPALANAETVVEPPRPQPKQGVLSKLRQKFRRPSKAEKREEEHSKAGWDALEHGNGLMISRPPEGYNYMAGRDKHSGTDWYQEQIIAQVKAHNAGR